MAVLVFLITAGCAHYGALQEDYGKSYNMAKYNQILNPGASENLEPVMGLDSKAAEAATKNYIGSFSKGGEQPAQQGVTVVMPSSTTGTDTYGK